MKQFVVCCMLVLVLSVYAVVGAQAGNAAAQRARRNFVDEDTLDRTHFQFKHQKKSHFVHPNMKRVRREAENADFYKRGDHGHAEERLKRVKKYNKDTVM